MVGVKQIKIEATEITIGMFISGLDRPWTQTPFPLQGFYVKDLEEINTLKSHCSHVYIDVIKGARPGRANLKTLTREVKSSKSVGRASAAEKSVVLPPLKVKYNTYPVLESLRAEVSQARALHREVFTAVANVMEHLVKGDASSAIASTKRTASAMVGSLLRCPDAFTWLTRVKEKDEHTYSHSIRSAIWGILLGRHMGLPKIELEALAMGLLLKDVGKTRLPQELLFKQNRTSDEQVEYERFVDIGVEILEGTPDISTRAVSIVKTHREFINGSGFPLHLRGDKIPLLGRIASVVTFYDEITSPRGEIYPLSPSKAVAQLYDARDTLFQGDMVVEFIRAIGLYPTGTLVELNTGEVAVVVEQNFERRLKPRIMIVLDAYKQKLPAPIFLDMTEDDNHKQVRINAGKLRLAEAEWIEIAQDLEPGAYEIDVTAICDVYVNRSEPTKAGLLSFLKGKKGLGAMFGS